MAAACKPPAHAITIGACDDDYDIEFDKEAISSIHIGNTALGSCRVEHVFFWAESNLY
jgi:hypothetical protein